MDQDLQQPQITFAAGVIAKAPTSRILMVKRTDTGAFSGQSHRRRRARQPVMVSPLGFRASFRSWCTARHVPVAIAERCLRARTQERGGGVLRRAEMLEDRREWMEKWAAFLGGADADNVVPMKRVTA